MIENKKVDLNRNHNFTIPPMVFLISIILLAVLFSFLLRLMLLRALIQ